MALWDRVKLMMAIQPTYERIETLHVRNIEGMDLGSSTVSDLLLRSQGLQTRAWRAASIREALGVPAVFGAVNFIANVTGSLTMRALRNEVEIPPAERPRLIVRPDPFTIPREFYRSTAYNLATRGEAWWWAAKRDIDGMPMSVINVAPHEVVVTENPRDLRYPIIKWRDVEMANEDFRQLVFAKEPGSLRGHGPLQMCGAAVSVAVESQEWAANFYADGGIPGTIVKTAGDLSDLSEQEMADLKAQWNESANNTTRFIDQGIESVEEHAVNQQGAQMLEARAHQNIDVATMFNMDAALLNAAVAGTSLTYQNVGMEFEKFLRQCLRTGYLEVIEQTMSDFLPRAVVARFNTAALTLADIKTRYDVYGVGIDKGIIDVNEARSFEGLAPGDVENAAVPYSPPQAIPDRLPIQRAASQGDTISDWRCSECGRKLAESAGPGTMVRCRCKALNTVPFIQARSEEPMLAAILAQREPIIIQPAAPVMNVHPAAAPNVSTPVTFEPGSIQVHAHFPAQGKTVKRIERDDAQNIIRIVEEESDGVVA
jgi:HK97 family phage portal protein